MFKKTTIKTQIKNKRQVFSNTFSVPAGSYFMWEYPQCDTEPYLYLYSPIVLNKDEEQLITLCQSLIKRCDDFNKSPNNLPIAWEEITVLLDFVMKQEMNSENEDVANLLADAHGILLDWLAFNMKKLYLLDQPVIWASLSDMRKTLHRIQYGTH